MVRKMSILALSIGEPAGIGPEIILAAWQMRKAVNLPEFYVLGDVELLEASASRLKREIPVRAVTPAEAAAHFDSALPVVPLENRLSYSPGAPSRANAEGVIEAITKGVEDVFAGQADALITCPIAKKALYDAGFPFPGHTEFLAHLAEERTGKAATPVMLLAGPDLRTVPVTVHQALSTVSGSLTREMIEVKGRITANELKQRFGLVSPRIAVSGLNPHAGEDGAMGREEIEIIKPAIERLCAEGIQAFGPMPADTMFHEAARSTYDVALCMYHDQALIPVKTLAFDDTVNVTLGLPFIRTSPDHGTAFDLAGRGIARPQSLIAAIKLARQLADNAARMSS